MLTTPRYTCSPKTEAACTQWRQVHPCHPFPRPDLCLVFFARLFKQKWPPVGAVTPLLGRWLLIDVANAVGILFLVSPLPRPQMVATSRSQHGWEVPGRRRLQLVWMYVCTRIVPPGSVPRGCYVLPASTVARHTVPENVANPSLVRKQHPDMVTPTARWTSRFVLQRHLAIYTVMRS
nr:hypothetical protein CFP56_34662 [Quercus suber]